MEAKQCECGCGGMANLGRRFLSGHNSKTDYARNLFSKVRAKADNYIRKDGYVVSHKGTSPILEHVLIAENAIGKPLPIGAEIHHVDYDKTNNSPSNLVVCPNRSYHALLHKRQRALDESGNANNVKCGYCGKYDSKESMYTRKDKYGYSYHRECERAYYQKRKSVNCLEGSAA